MKILKNIVAAAAFAGLAATSMSSHAGLYMTIDDLSTVGIDWSSDPLLANQALLQSPLTPISANWALSANTGLANGWSSIFGIDLLSLAVSSFGNGTSTLRVTFTETNLSFGVNGGPLAVNSAIGGVTQGSVTYTSWIDDANVAFGHGQQIFNGTSSFGPFEASGGTVALASDPFSLTLQVDITHSGAKNTSFNFESTVPEPGTLALLSLALLGAGVATRRRNKA